LAAAILAAAALLSWSTAHSQQGDAVRVALLIGNARYPDSDAPLKHPVNDVRAVAQQLQHDGFDVDVGENLGKDGMRSALDRFYGKIKRGSVALVFFSGYGIQSGRQTYVIPVDGQIWSEADVRRDGFNIEAMLAEMNARGANVKIAILDASRRNPFERRFRSGSMGLAPVVAPKDSLVAYSAAPGALLNESSEDSGLFVRELIRETRVAGATIEEVFNRARIAVSRASRGEQVPWFSSSLSDSFAINSSSRPAATAAKSAPPPEKPATSSPAAQPKTDKPTPQPEKSASQDPGPKTAARPRINDPAIDDLDRVIERNPNDGAAFNRRGQLYAKHESFRAALQDFDEAVRINPRHAEALNNRCWIRAIVGELQQALSDCNDALKVRSNYADALDSRGFVHLKRGDPAKAIVDYDAALAIKPDLASSLYGRGLARLRRNDSKGDADITRAKALNPGIAQEFANYDVR
jgi:tetratricopeptide (TPR) repeat protein